MYCILYVGCVLFLLHPNLSKYLSKKQLRALLFPRTAFINYQKQMLQMPYLPRRTRPPSETQHYSLWCELKTRRSQSRLIEFFRPGDCAWVSESTFLDFPPHFSEFAHQSDWKPNWLFFGWVCFGGKSIYTAIPRLREKKKSYLSISCAWKSVYFSKFLFYSASISALLPIERKCPAKCTTQSNQ